jgi:hypothetical protein
VALAGAIGRGSLACIIVRDAGAVRAGAEDPADGVSLPHPITSEREITGRRGGKEAGCSEKTKDFLLS